MPGRTNPYGPTPAVAECRRQPRHPHADQHNIAINEGFGVAGIAGGSLPTAIVNFQEPDVAGLDVMSAIGATRSAFEIVLMPAYATIKRTVKAMTYGSPARIPGGTRQDSTESTSVGQHA